MLFISIAFTLFALMAGTLLLAKAKTEGLGKLFTWVSYLVIVVSLAMLVCQGIRGIMRMTCRRDSSSSEHCMQGMMNGGCDRGGCMMMHHGWMRERQGGCMGMEREEEMEMCKTKMDSSCCKGEMKHGCEMDEKDEKGEKEDAEKKK